MIPLVAQVCVGCGQILDELELSNGRPSWIAAAVYSEKYGYMFTDLHLIGDVCPPCARMLTIGRRELLAG